MERSHSDIPLYVHNLRIHDGPPEIEKERRIRNLLVNANFMARLGIKQEDVDNLSVIHVAGTKGKGSTSAITESILRARGFKTGLFTSPHVKEYRERIRILGKPLSREDFTREFFRIHDDLHATEDLCKGESVIPRSFFQYFWLLSLRIFIAEKVDVAIVEVGIGGEYDVTNTIRNPVVCGITTLDLDHVEILGSTFGEIAWCKAGIFKEGTPAFVEPQTMEAMDVIAQRAVERKCPVHLVPEYSTYYWRGEETKPGLDGEVQKLNASLALQMAHTWIRLHDKPESIRRKPFVRQSAFTGKDIPLAHVFEVDDKTKQGLRQCFLPGRHHLIERGKITYFLDGAHTPISLKHVAKWFQQKIKEEAAGRSNIAKVLIVNVAMDRDLRSNLGPLMPLELDAVVFSPNFLDGKEQKWEGAKTEELLTRTADLAALWKEMKKEIGVQPSLTFPVQHITEAMQWIETGKTNGNNKIPNLPESVKSADHVQVFITGSMRLVGNALLVLDPECNL